MAAAPLHSFRDGDVYDQISRFEQRRGSQEEEEDDGHSPSPPPGPAMELPSRLYECKSVVRALDVSCVSLTSVFLGRDIKKVKTGLKPHIGGFCEIKAVHFETRRGRPR